MCLAQVCHKQYSSASEMEVHLSSYDHHHKKVCPSHTLNCLYSHVRAHLNCLVMSGEVCVIGEYTLCSQSR